MAPLIVPNPGDPRLTERVAGTDQTGASVEINVPVERALTLYLNAQEIVTMMTIGDYPEYLAVGPKPHRLRPEPGLCRRGIRPPQAQGRRP
jgi:hypothetical protein